MPHEHMLKLRDAAINVSKKNKEFIKIPGGMHNDSWTKLGLHYFEILKRFFKKSEKKKRKFENEKKKQEIGDKFDSDNSDNSNNDNDNSDYSEYSDYDLQTRNPGYNNQYFIEMVQNFQTKNDLSQYIYGLKNGNQNQNMKDEMYHQKNTNADTDTDTKVIQNENYEKQSFNDIDNQKNDNTHQFNNPIEKNQFLNDKLL